MFVVLLGSAYFGVVDSREPTDSSCNCDHCDEKKVTSIETNETVDETDGMNVEDADGDGNRTICARDRDEEDRSFSSVCRMLCHNSCTRYRIWIYLENNVKKYTAFAFRTSEYLLFLLGSRCCKEQSLIVAIIMSTDYYKLHDGAC